ncbi:farnesyltransferase subunit beta [Spatholobus suberectus]|nr:farnesyltransferase subunit beta [Spatholobus suberectus]
MSSPIQAWVPKRKNAKKKERCVALLLAVSGDTMNEESERETNPSAEAPPCPTVTQRDQWMVESQVFQIYELFATIPPNAKTLMYVSHCNISSLHSTFPLSFSQRFSSLRRLELQRDNHMEYLSKGLRHLSSAFSVLDANRPWLCYWIFHSIALLGESVDDELEDDTIAFLNRSVKLMKVALQVSLDWVVFRQGKECGFQGRTNKLVDGCYSFWQGGAVALLQRLYDIINKQMEETSQSFTISDVSEEKENLDGTSSHATCCGRHEGTSGSCSADFKNIGYNFINELIAQEPLFHTIALQQYILLCAQEQEGGMRDKPGKRRDHYHTCYCLSGLSLCQYSWSKHPDSPPLPKQVSGPYSNLLEPIHPLFNVVLERYREAHEFFFTES